MFVGEFEVVIAVVMFGTGDGVTGADGVVGSDLKPINNALNRELTICRALDSYFS